MQNPIIQLDNKSPQTAPIKNAKARYSKREVAISGRITGI